ncbi:hypothetical protein D3C79_972460 [compost metagenome]
MSLKDLMLNPPGCGSFGFGTGLLAPKLTKIEASETEHALEVDERFIDVKKCDSSYYHDDYSKGPLAQRS